MKEQEFLTELKEMDMLQQALAILEWDAQTGMPAEASNAPCRSHPSYLYRKIIF